MQSNASKALVAIGSVLAVVALFIVLSSDEEGGSSEQATTDAPSGSSTAPLNGDGSQSQQNDRPRDPEAEGGEEVPTIVITDGQPAGGVQELEFTKSDEIRFAIRSDVDDEVHVHGYDVSAELRAGETTGLAFPAEIDGVYEVELERSAVPIAELTVNP